MLAYLQGLKFGEVSGIAYSPASATFGIIPTDLEMRDVRCLVSPSCAFCSSHLDNSLLLVELVDFDEFERVMRTVRKSVLETLKRLEIMYLNWGPKCTLLMTHCINIAYCICVSAWCNKTVVIIFGFDPFYTIHLHLASALAQTISSSTLFVPFSCGCCWFRETAAAQQRDVRLLSLEKVSPEILHH